MDRVWQSIVADFKQRTRQQSYAVSLLLMAALTFLFFPSPDSEYQTLVINGYRGLYNSAWIGACLAMLNMLLLPLICFYLVKNAIELDRRSQTCELIAATSVSKQTYLFSKWCVNVFTLVSVIFVMLLSSILVQLYYGESTNVDFWMLIWPQLVFVFPMLLVIASIAIMFETIKWLRGSAGNLVYFFLWVASIMYMIESVSGVGALMKALDEEVTERFPSASGTTNAGLSAVDENSPIKTFLWQGLEPTMTDVWATLPFMIISLCCLAIAYCCFDRFSVRTDAKKSGSGWLDRVVISKLGRFLDLCFGSLTKHFNFAQLTYLEFKILLKGRSSYWFIGLVGLNVAQFTVEQPLLTSIILPISWLWCVLVISQIGQFEKQSRTQELVTYSQKSALTQNLACYLSAWKLLLLASLGSLIRFAATEEWLFIVQVVVAVSFTVSLAFLCGTLSGTKRLFEGFYPIFWYLGPTQAALYLDFFGSKPQASWDAGMPYIFSIIAVTMLGLTLILRRR